MKRKEFISLLAIGASAGLITTTLERCTKSSDMNQPQNVDFTINLNDASYNALNNAGGYLVKNGIIIARLNSSSFVALNAYCTHQGCQVIFNGTSSFPCPCHGSVFDTNGNVLQGPAQQNLTKYKTQLTGSTLRIYS